MNHLAWIEISKAKIARNIKTIREINDPNTIISPCIKANAYGHGLIETAKILIESGVEWLSVNSTEEAQKVRAAGINHPILVIGFVAEYELEKIFDLNLRLFISNINYAQKLSDLGKAKNQTANIHLKIDTGMHRHGVLLEHSSNLAKEILKLPNIKIEGLATHFANSDDPLNPEYFNRQLEKFKIAINDLKKIIGHDLIIHCHKSASVLLSRDNISNLIRPGISVYGYYPSLDVANLAKERNLILQPALEFKTIIGQIKNIPENSLVGYGCTYKTTRPTITATIPVGYYDGYDRKLGNKAYVLVNGKKATVLGRICMNVTIIDITDCGSVTSGDEVVLIGQQKDEVITVEQLADWANTINYEIITRLRESLPRYYL